MCTVSMVISSKTAEWEDRYPARNPAAPPWPGFYPTQQMPTQQEIDEFRRLLEKARQYDIDHDQPACDSEAKKERIRALADKLGVDVSFV